MKRLEAILNSLVDGVIIISRDMQALWANKIIMDLYGNTGEMYKEKCYNFFYGLNELCSGCPSLKVFADEKPHRSFQYVIDHNNKPRWVDLRANPYYDEDNNLVGSIGVITDHTKIKKIEEALREREEELEIKTNSLQEVNVAMRVLLKRRDQDKTELEEKVLSNVKDLVVPCVEKMKNSRLDPKQLAYINIIESTLNDIISPFSRTLTSKYLNLTPTEIHVSNLIKEGKSNKEMAGLMNLSIRTIEFHRDNIRKKLGLKNQKANLKTHLLSLT